MEERQKDEYGMQKRHYRGDTRGDECTPYVRGHAGGGYGTRRVPATMGAHCNV